MRREARRAYVIMNKQPSRWVFIAHIAVTVLLLSSCGRAPSYLSFIAKDPKYYQKLTEACDEVLKKYPAGFKARNRLPANISLPSALQDLHPTAFSVSTNRVFFGVGIGRGAYGVSWQPLNSGRYEVWELRTHAEGIEKIVYTRVRVNGQKGFTSPNQNQ